MQFGKLKRREFITLLGGAAVWPRVARTQQSALPLVAFLDSGSAASDSGLLAAFRESLAQRGYSEGRDYRFAKRHADGVMARMPELAQEVIRLDPRVIITSNTAATLAIRHETAIIPIVCTTCTDPVGIGLVLSEARPGTNVTGLLTRVDGTTGKQLELARDVVHGLTKIGVLINSSNQSNAVQQQEAVAAAVKLGVTLVPAPVSLPTDLHAAFQTLSRESVEMVLVLQDAMFLAERKRIALFAAAVKLPTLFSFRENVEDGGLMSYRIDLRENYRRTAVYVDKILKGEKPADLPIEFPTRLVLVINLQMATAIGLTVPESILLRADKVIE